MYGSRKLKQVLRRIIFGFLECRISINPRRLYPAFSRSLTETKLSKAFERVNPYWIFALLRIKKAPGWLITYTRFVLFQRRVTHKVQGRLLPSRTLRQGVDMGRSFSVYLFCLAMDPLFTCLNEIPGVLAVSYVDDTTIAGDGQDLTWIGQVESCCQDLQTAGFVIDPHSCYFACVVINNRAPPTGVSALQLTPEKGPLPTLPQTSTGHSNFTVWLPCIPSNRLTI